MAGLDTPKGLAMYGKYLYAANINQVAVIDIKKAKLIKQVLIDSAFEWNDLTVDDSYRVDTSFSEK